jgi:hypothetical protein
VRVTSSSCAVPKHRQPDQEPTPIDCQIFKELLNQPLIRLFPHRLSSERANYTQVF